MKNSLIKAALFFLILFGLQIASAKDVPLQPFELHYSISMPGGEVNDFISATSYKGIGITSLYKTDEKVDLGVTLDWIRFESEKESGTFQVQGLSLSGTQKKLLDTTALMAMGQYNLGGSLNPYVGAGFGGAYMDKLHEVGFLNFNSYGLQWLVAPEVGLKIPTGSTHISTALRYYLGWGNGAELPAMNTLSLQLGVVF